MIDVFSTSNHLPHKLTIMSDNATSRNVSLDARSTPTRKRKGTIEDNHPIQLDLSTYTSNIQEEMEANTQELDWEIVIPAIFDQGQRPLSDGDVKCDQELFFPRRDHDKIASPTVQYDDFPTWHKKIVEKVMTSSAWAKAKEMFDNAMQESDLYSPFQGILNAITSETHQHPIAYSGALSTLMTWIKATADRTLIPEAWCVSADCKPDICGVWGITPTHLAVGEVFLQPATSVARVYTSDVLVPVEVEFVKPKTSQVDDVFAAETTRQVPAGLKLDTAPTRDAAIPFISLTENSEGAPRGTNWAGKSRQSSGQSAGPTIPALLRRTGESSGGSSNSRGRKRPKTTVDPSITIPKDSKLSQIGKYLNAIREAQEFRNAGIGIVLQNDMFTLVFSDPTATIAMKKINIFLEPKKFISTIIFLVTADYPALGFDTLWVNRARVPHVGNNPTGAVKADPRNVVGRLIDIPDSDESRVAQSLLARRSGLHARCTTVFEVLRGAAPSLELPASPTVLDESDVSTSSSMELEPVTTESDSSLTLEVADPDPLSYGMLEVCKISFQPPNRKAESEYLIAGQPYAHLPTIHTSAIIESSFWAHPALTLYKPVEIRRQHILCMTPRCRAFWTVADNQELLKFFRQALQGTISSSTASLYLINKLISIRLVHSVDRGRHSSPRYICGKPYGHPGQIPSRCSHRL